MMGYSTIGCGGDACVRGGRHAGLTHVTQLRDEIPRKLTQSRSVGLLTQALTHAECCDSIRGWGRAVTHTRQEVVR